CRFRGGGRGAPPCHARQKPFLPRRSLPPAAESAALPLSSRRGNPPARRSAPPVPAFPLLCPTLHRFFCVFTVFSPTKTPLPTSPRPSLAICKSCGACWDTPSLRREGKERAVAGVAPFSDWLRAGALPVRPEGFGVRGGGSGGSIRPRGYGELTGLGAHHPKKQQGREKPYDIKPKAQRIMNQFGPSTLINLSNFSSIKPEPASTPPQSSMANSTTVAKMPGTPSGGGRLSPESNQVLTKKKLQDLVREVDPNEQLDEDVEEMLLQIADDFIESVVTAACQLARHRKSNTLEVKDVQLHLERQWNMWIPGFGSEEIRPYKKACTTEAHKQRMALIRKTTKK
uniref:Transcription initiation factor TFIID subunit 12 n=1 Tax=Amazona collaria TaxID=241587 RepID=A0A8B9G3Y6_9PSIT